VPIRLSANCLLYVDPTLLVSLATFPLNATGAGSVSFVLPADARFAGLTFALQGAVVSFPLATHLTNGLGCTLGYVNG
jgi:hypothetical protein